MKVFFKNPFNFFREDPSKKLFLEKGSLAPLDQPVAHIGAAVSAGIGPSFSIAVIMAQDALAGHSVEAAGVVDHRYLLGAGALSSPPFSMI